jgi:hypothetical protein
MKKLLVLSVLCVATVVPSFGAEHVVTRSPKVVGHTTQQAAEDYRRTANLHWHLRGPYSTDFVLLLMSQHSASSILSSKVKIGGNATAAAGPVGRTSSAETDVKLNAEILSYSRARGLFAGISLAGSTLRPDTRGLTP